MTTRRTLTMLALLSAGALAFAGCASSSTPPAASPTDDAPVTTELEVDAGWLDGGRTVALVTQGSSTCVPSASDVTLQADGSVAVTLTDPEGQPCTRDLVPRATLVQLPEGVDGAGAVDLVVTYGEARGETDLEGYAGPAVDEYSPSAGWIDDGLFAILTYGSSSCAPVIEDVTVADGNQVTVTFVTPAADQVCTMDMAPRVVLASVEGVDDDVATVTLTGGGVEFETPVTIEIVG